MNTVHTTAKDLRIIKTGAKSNTKWRRRWAIQYFSDFEKDWVYLSQNFRTKREARLALTTIKLEGL